MIEETFLERRNIYLGTFTFVKISALFSRETIPSFVASVKKENISWPENKYIV